MTTQRPHIDLWRDACDGIRDVANYNDEEVQAYHSSAWLIPPAIWLGDGRYVGTTQKAIDALVTIAAAAYRFLVVKRAPLAAVPADITQDGVTYRHVNIAIEPRTPSVQARAGASA